MATHLTPQDLANFLRSRKSVNCRIAADWVEENPNAPTVKKAVDWLEERLLAMPEGMDLLHAAAYIARSQPPSLWLNLPQRENALGTACLAFVADRYKEWPGQTNQRAWESLQEAARTIISHFAPAWAATVVHMVRPRPPQTSHKDPNKKEYVVQFLILKEVMVTSPDDIQAELDAMQKLTPNQREAVQKYRVLYGNGKPVGDGDFYTPDKQFWEENL